MTASRKGRSGAALLGEKRFIVLVGVIALAITVAISLVGNSGRQLTGALCSVCPTLPTEAERSACFNAPCTPDGGGSSGSGCTGSQPSWPDCAVIGCMSNAWACTQMRSSAGGGGTSSYAGDHTSSYSGGGTSSYTGGGTSSYTGGYASSGDPFAMCVSGCAGASTCIRSYCCTMRPADSLCVSSSSVGTTSSTGGAGGASSMTMSPAACWAACTQGMASSNPDYNGRCRTQCNYYDGTGVGYSSGGYSMSPREGWITNCMSTQGLSRPMCEEKCNATGSGCPTDSGSQWSSGGTGGGANVEWCFYPNASRNGTTLGYGVDCPKADAANCYRGSHNTPNPTKELPGLTLGSPSSCYWDYGFGGGGGTTGGTGWTGSSTGGGGMTTVDACKSRCTIGTMPGATPAMLDSCMRGCEGSGGGSTGGGWTGGGVQCMAPSEFIECGDPRCKSNSSACMRRPTSEVWNGKTLDCVLDYCARGGGGGGGGTQRYTCEKPLDCSVVNCAVAFPWRGEFDSPQSGMNCWQSGGGGGIGEIVRCCTRVPPCTANICPSVMPSCEQKSRWQCEREGGDVIGGGGWTGGGGGWTDVTYARQNLLRPLENYLRQSEEMTFRARENSVNVSADITAYVTAVKAAITCVNGAQTPETINSCGRLESIEQLGMSIWNKIQTGSMTRQFSHFDGEIKHMEEAIAQAGQGVNIQPLKELILALRSAIESAKAAMQNTASTPEQTRMAMQNVYDLQSKFWQTFESLRGRDHYAYGRGNEGGGYANQCDTILEKMKYIQGKEGNEGVAAKFQDMYQQCIRMAQGAVTGKGFDQREFRSIQDNFEETYDRHVFTVNACDGAQRGAQEARMAITTFAPQMIQQISKKNPAVGKKLDGLLQIARTILTRVEAQLAQDDCDGALASLDQMEGQVREPFERAMEGTGFDMGDDEEISFVDYDEDYEDLYEGLEDEVDIGFKQFKSKMEAQGYRSRDLALLKGIDTKLLAEYIQYAVGTSGTDIVQAAAKGGVSTVKVEQIIEENNTMLKKIAELELAVKNLKAGVKTIVEKIKEETFNPSVAPKIVALLEVASSLPEKEFRAKYEQYITESNEQNYEDGIDPYKDVHTFEEDHGWFVEAVKETSGEGELFTGVKPGIFAPEQTANVAEVVTTVARSLDVAESDASPDSALAKAMPTWAKEPAAGLDEVLALEDTNLSKIFADSKPSDAATRLEVARLIATSYEDVLPDAEASVVLENYDDLAKLSATDRDAVAHVVAAGIMTGSGDEFHPDGEFNRAQFATVMYRLSALETDIEGEGTVTVEDQDSEGTFFTNTATQPQHAAAEEEEQVSESESAPEPEPAFYAEKISEQNLTIIRSLVGMYQSQHNKLSTDRAVMQQVSLVQDAVDSLNAIQYEKFDRMRKENFPAEWIAKQTIDLKVLLPEVQLSKIVEICKEAGHPMQQ